MELFRTLVETAPIAMVVVGADGVILLVNAQTEKLFQYDRPFLLGQPVEVLVPERFRSNHSAHRAGYFSSPEPRALGAGRDLFGLRNDGTEFPIEIGLTPSGPEWSLSRLGCRIMKNQITISDGEFVLASIIDITERKKADERAHQMFASLIEGVKDYGIFLLDPTGNVRSWNEGAARIKGYSESEILGKHFSRFYTPEANNEGHPERVLEIARAQGKFEEEGWRVRRDGSRFWASVLITTLVNSDGSVVGFTKLTRDITERKRSEVVRESERELRLLADAMPQMVWTAGPDGGRDYYNRRWYDFSGMPPGTVGDHVWQTLVHPKDRQSSHEHWLSAVKSGEDFEAQCRFWDRESNSYRWYLGRALPLRDENGHIVKWIGTYTDIEDQKRFSAELETRVATRTEELNRSLLDKTTLLKEVHHRVKNNLQVICSLLSMQMRSVDAAVASPLKEAHHRVLAMSLIHEQIYQSDALSDLNFGEYIRSLVGKLFESYCIDSSLISLRVKTEPLHLPLDQAIPCGLILNELVSNCLKHAFRGSRRGTIRVSLRRTEGDLIELTVEDNGVGLPRGFRIEDATSLGLKVVRALTEQLGGSLNIVNNNGAAFALVWNLAVPN